MACTTAPAPGAQLRPGDRLDEIDTALFLLEQLCRVITSLGSACPANARTDGIDPEPFHVLFDWLADELHDVRLHLEHIHQELLK